MAARPGEKIAGTEKERNKPLWGIRECRSTPAPFSRFGYGATWVGYIRIRLYQGGWLPPFLLANVSRT